MLQRPQKVIPGGEGTETSVAADAENSQDGGFSKTGAALWRKVEGKMNLGETACTSSTDPKCFSVPSEPWPRRWDEKVRWMLQCLDVKSDALFLARSTKLIGKEGHFLSIADFFKELVNIVVRSAARYGRTDVLTWLWDGGLWYPTDVADAKAAVDGVESDEQLMALLGVFDMRVPRSMADSYAECLAEQVKSLSSGQAEPESSMQPIPVASGSRSSQFAMAGSSNYAMLVANFVTVAHSINRRTACEVMDNLVDKRQFLLGPRDEVTKVVSVSVQREEMNFPVHLGTIFVRRNVSFNANTLKYVAGEEGKGYVVKDGIRTPTSEASQINVPPEVRMSALIPACADKFVFVYNNGAWLQTGGYLYLDSGDKPVALNPISFEVGDHIHALSFGLAIEIDRAIQVNSDDDAASKGWSKITVDALRDKGARYFKWVGPDSREWRDELPFGGFAYLFENARCRLFPMTGSGELINRGSVEWELNAAELPWRPPEEDDTCKTLQSIISWSWLDIVRGALRASCCHWLASSRIFENVTHAAAYGRPVTFARVLIPGPLHPSLLHAIANSQCKPVVCSLAAKAIVGAAFRAIIFTFATDILHHLLAFGLLWAVIYGMKHDLEESDDHLVSRLPLRVRLCLVFLMLGTFRTVFVELVILKEYVMRGWTKSYLSLWRGLTVVNVSVSIAMVTCYVFSVNVETLKVITSVAFSLRLLKLISFMLAMETYRLGFTIAPIIKSVVACASFLLIVVCILLVFLCMFWGLSDTNRALSRLLLSLYRLGFLGDFDMEEDVATSEAAHMQMWEEGTFVLVTVIVSVALMNISIGMLTTYYDHYLERATELFVRTRSEVCVAYLLRRHGLRKLVCRRRSGGECRSRGTVWFCYREEDEDESVEEISMRTQFGSLAHQVRGSDQRVQDRLQRLEDLTVELKGLLRKSTGEEEASETRDGPRQPAPNGFASMSSALVPGGTDPPASDTIDSLSARTNPEPPRAAPPTL